MFFEELNMRACKIQYYVGPHYIDYINLKMWLVPVIYVYALLSTTSTRADDATLHGVLTEEATL